LETCNMSEEEIESEATKSIRHFISGAVAGMAEHTGAFPIDTLKTHMQARNTTVTESCRNITASTGARGFFRGWTAVLIGAAPAHAIYFTAYELIKKFLGNNPASFAAAGSCATFLNDAVMTPMDVVKQRRQLNVKAYRGTWHCLKSVIRLEGFGALYAGFTTTIVMNIPFHSIYFNVYEFLRQHLKNRQEEKDSLAFSTQLHFVAGAGAGSAAAAITNPLDVAKTKLQTRGDLGYHYKGMIKTLSRIWVNEGIGGLTRGIFPRMLFHSFSAAILWTTYEYMKYCFGVNSDIGHNH